MELEIGKLYRSAWANAKEHFFILLDYKKNINPLILCDFEIKILDKYGVENAIIYLSDIVEI